MKKVKNVFRTMSAVAVLTVTFMACEKEEVEVDQTVETTTSQTRMPILATPVAYGPDLLVTLVTSDLPIVNPTACGGAGPQTTCSVNYNLTVKVTNIGNAPVEDYYHVEMDKPTGDVANNVKMSPTMTLAPGASHDYNFGPAPFGGCLGIPYSIQDLVITADVYDEIRETNETNNTARPYRYCGD